jgi:transposase
VPDLGAQRRLDRDLWMARLRRWLARQPQTARVRVARRLLTRVWAQTREIRDLQGRLHTLVAGYRPALLEIPGCGPLTAAKLIAETAGAERFATDARFARAAGVAPIPASSGRKDRFRLDRGGNRQLNLALHRLAVNQGRLHPPPPNYLARKQAAGKSRMDALRCLKRHLARTVHTTMNNNANAPAQPLALT